MNQDQRAAFEAWQASQNPKVYPAERQAFEAGWKAALQSPEVIVTQYMAECITTVRDELIEAGVIGKEVATMFLADAVLGHVMKLRKDAAYYRWLRANWTRLRTTYYDNALHFSVVADSFCEITEADIDAAIIAAMEKQK